jgi:hypothetical protein
MQHLVRKHVGNCMAAMMNCVMDVKHSHAERTLSYLLKGYASGLCTDTLGRFRYHLSRMNIKAG